MAGCKTVDKTYKLHPTMFTAIVGRGKGVLTCS